MLTIWGNLHTSHTNLVKICVEEGVISMTILSQREISNALDIGPKFLFLDSCEILDPGVASRASYIFDERHKFISQHFLSGIIVPGVLILESMLQSMALTIYSTKSWRGLALVTDLNAQFLSSLQLNSKIENQSRITVKSGGRIHGEVTCISNQKIISKITCSYYSDHILQALKKKWR
jgi:3-hydroxymyristoyl/3-hydroxydecanoyl-(acyl carrier protein) dehydratase